MAWDAFPPPTTTITSRWLVLMKDMIKLLKDQRKDGIFSVWSLHVSAASTDPLWCGQLLPSVHRTGILSTSSTGSLPIDRPESCVGLYRCGCCVCVLIRRRNMRTTSPSDGWYLSLFSLSLSYVENCERKDQVPDKSRGRWSRGAAPPPVLGCSAGTHAGPPIWWRKMAGNFSQTPNMFLSERGEIVSARSTSHLRGSFDPKVTPMVLPSSWLSLRDSRLVIAVSLCFP